jgi:hypothetical protein
MTVLVNNIYIPLFYLYYSLVGIGLGFHPTIGSISWLFSLEWVDSTLGMIQRWIYRSIAILLKTHMHPFIMLVNSIPLPKKRVVFYLFSDCLCLRGG